MAVVAFNGCATSASVAVRPAYRRPPVVVRPMVQVRPYYRPYYYTPRYRGHYRRY